MLTQETELKPDKPDNKDEKPEKLSAKEVLEQHLELLNNRVPPIVKKMISNSREQGSPIEALKLFNALKDLTTQICDVAHKLAPYQSPKMESVEIKSQVEHRYVIRAPEPILNVQAWLKKTGAEYLKLENHHNSINAANGSHTNGHVNHNSASAPIIQAQAMEADEEEERIADEQRMIQLDPDSTDPPPIKNKRKRKCN